MEGWGCGWRGGAGGGIRRSKGQGTLITILCLRIVNGGGEIRRGGRLGEDLGFNLVQY